MLIVGDVGNGCSFLVCVIVSESCLLFFKIESICFMDLKFGVMCFMLLFCCVCNEVLGILYIWDIDLIIVDCECINSFELI